MVKTFSFRGDKVGVTPKREVPLILLPLFLGFCYMSEGTDG